MNRGRDTSPGTGLRLARVALLAFACALSIGSAAQAQGTKADYERAAGLRERFDGLVLNARLVPQWIDGGARLVYRLDEPGGSRRWVVVDARSGEAAPAFDHERMARALSEKRGAEVDAAKLPLERLVIDGQRVLVLAEGGQAWITDAAVSSLEPGEEALAQLLEAPRRARQARSGRTGEETALVFINRTGGPVRLVWRDTEGDSQEYGTLPAGEQRRQHTFAGHVWEILSQGGQRLGMYVAGGEPGVVIIEEVEAAATREADGGAREAQERGATAGRGRERNVSPDGRLEILFNDHNAQLRNRESGESSPLTSDGTEAQGYRGEVVWSADSKYVAFMQHRRGGDRKVYYVESSPRDQLQPKLESYDYLKPGDPIPQDRPVMFDAESGQPVEFENELFDNPWSISQMHFAPDGGELRFLYNQRGHQVMRLVGVSTSGSVRSIIEEKSPTFIDYSQKTYLHRLEDSDELIWASERDGWNHLYLYSAADGSCRRITGGQWVVREVDRVDEEKRQIWFHASGIVAGQDPYHLHYCRVNFDGSGLVVLTEGDGTHTVQMSPDGERFIDTYSRVDLPPVTELRSAEDGALIAKLAAADAEALESAGWKMPERFVARGRDGKTDIWGMILRPSNFDPAKKYPVIEYIYAGPHGAHVPKSFRSFYGQQELAELGFVLVMIDGMGTNHRGKAFHDVAFKNIADAGFPDRVLWMKAAAEHEPAMDISRVGIYGGSAGGQNAMRALLDHNDFYDAAVADCGCHDNRMDKIWWNEAWMSWPVDESYERSSNMVDAHKLEGKLLLLVGEADRNVDPASTMQVVDALVRADKDFEFLMVPGAGHGTMGIPHVKRRFHDFFVRSLWGVEPRAE